MLDNDSRLDPAVERRASRRFPIEQEVSYRVLDHKAIVPDSGVGRTFDISSGGVLFATEQRLRSGKRIELSVNWPAVLEGGCLLKFVAVGRIVRVEDARASITIEQYEFRTRRAKDTAAVGPEKPPRSVVQYS
jgi:hypothetical protein